MNKYEVFEAIQYRLENDKEFAQEFYKCILESMFHLSELADIKDLKFGNSCIYEIKND